MQTISSTPAAGFLFRERPRTRTHGEGREATVGTVRRYAKDEEIFGEGIAPPIITRSWRGLSGRPSS
jgi:hypothetical protein